MSGASGEDPREALEREVADLEARLYEAKQRLASQDGVRPQPDDDGALPHHVRQAVPSSPALGSAQHYLLLLSDSALPLGSFAFSSGLESYKTHMARGPAAAGAASFTTFLPRSLSSYASTTLPFVLAAHRDPALVADLDDAYDAAVICTVGRRASVAQGRALLGVWEKSFAPAAGAAERAVISDLRRGMAASSSSSSSGVNGIGGDDLALPGYSAHLAPLFGAVCRLLGMTLHQTAYVFMLSHVKALVSAGVRAAMMGPYVAQRILASGEVQDMITAMIEREWDTKVEEAGQSVPVMDLWVGRHEMLYSRIFNS
ncbi:hypothetical protein JX266_001714 [Neoarthrinium moseri]|nr:hypothetical protein JX266_001714 [Neoarthrinium moseri]